jgi:flagellar transcriptional activator FlhC
VEAISLIREIINLISKNIRLCLPEKTKRFVESGMLELSRCNSCDGNFITHAHQPVGSFVCSLCQPPSRAVKRRKLSRDAADIIPQLLDEQIEQAV